MHYAHAVQANFNVQLSKLKIEHELDNLFNQVMEIIEQQEDETTAVNPQQFPAQILEQLKKYLSVLFYFERITDNSIQQQQQQHFSSATPPSESSSPYVAITANHHGSNHKGSSGSGNNTHNASAYLKTLKQSLQKWILQTATNFIKIASIEDYQYLIYELVHCSSGIGQWATSLIQVVKQQYDKTIREVDEVPTIAVEGKEQDETKEEEEDGKKTLLNTRAEIQVEQFLVLLHVILNHESNSLTEDDYLAIWNRFPLYSLIHQLFDHVCSCVVLV